MHSNNGILVQLQCYNVADCLRMLCCATSPQAECCTWFTSFFAAETLATPWPVRRNFFILDNCATCSRRAWYVCRALAASHLLRAVCLLTTDVVLFCSILNILKCLIPLASVPLLMMRGNSTVSGKKRSTGKEGRSWYSA